MCNNKYFNTQQNVKKSEFLPKNKMDVRKLNKNFLHKHTKHFSS